MSASPDGSRRSAAPSLLGRPGARCWCFHRSVPRADPNKDTGLGNLPLRDAASNAVWVAVVLLACDLLTWTQTLA